MNVARQILNEETPKEFFKRRGSGGDVPPGYFLLACRDGTLMLYKENAPYDIYIANIRERIGMPWRYYGYGGTATGKVLCFNGDAETKREAVDMAIKAWRLRKAANPSEG